MMTSLERVTAALQFREPDRVPVYPLLCGISRRLVNADYKTWATDPEVCAQAYIRVTEKYDLDIICTLIDLSVEAADFGAKLVYPENEAAHPDYTHPYIAKPEDYKKIAPVDPRQTPRMSSHLQLCRKLVEAKGKEVPVVAFVFGPLGILSMLRGQQNLFMDLITHAELVKSALEPITETLLDYCTALVSTGVHAIMLDTLFASKSIMSKQMWLEFEGVHVKKLAEHIHNQGCMVMVHNCGGGMYMDVQLETMQPEAVSFLHLPDDVASAQELKEKYGGRTTLIGHIDPTWIIHATEDEVREECRKQIDQYKAGGGYILATGCEYPANADFRNAEVMVQVAKEYGKYV